MVGESATIGEREVDLVPERMTTLRTLIGELVAGEVASHEDRRRERSILRVLTPTDLTRGADSGKVAAEQRTGNAAPPLAEAVARAVEAFEDGLYFVVVDGTVVTELDAALTLSSDSRLRLVRLVALAGG